MLISVVIPAFNAEAFLDKAIRSVLSQTYEPLELIVVNDGSTDRTADIAASFSDPRMQQISQPNSGVVTARNRGLEVSSGHLIAFLDADDRWHPNKLSVQARAMKKWPECVAVGCLMRYESLGGKSLGIAGQEVGPEDQDRIRCGFLMPFPISATLFSREAVANIGGFDETLARSIPGQVEDLDLLARIAFQGTIETIPERLGVYLIHGQSASARHFASQRMGTRFVRARLEERAQGNELTWEEFRQTYRPTWRQRYGDRVQASYRRTGLLAAEENWGAAAISGAVTSLLGPRYTFRRFMRQRYRKREQD